LKKLLFLKKLFTYIIMRNAGLNSLICNPPQDEKLPLGAGFRASFADEDDNTKPQDTDNDSSSSEIELPNLEQQVSRGDPSATEPESMPISISGSNNAPWGGAPDTSESGVQKGECPKEMQIPTLGNSKIKQSAPQPCESLNSNASLQQTHWPNSHLTQNHQTQPNNHEQDPQLYHQLQQDNLSILKQHLNEVNNPQHQQPGIEQTLQFPALKDRRYAPAYKQQVQASSSPQPLVYEQTLWTPQWGQPLVRQPSLLAAPHTKIMDQQHPHWDVSCSDVQSVSSVGSSYPSVVSTPIWHGSYYDQNFGNQHMISPVSTKCHPSSQMFKHNLAPSHDVPLFDLNAPGRSIPSDIQCSNKNQMKGMIVPSSIPREPYLKLETASANTEINIAPLQRVSTTTQPRLKKKGGWAAIYMECFSYAEEQGEKHSNLYVNWTGSADQLRYELQLKSLEVNSIQVTTIKDLWNVVFDSHSSARKAFTTQREIKIRMVPPRRSKKNWYRNPSPKFLVQYETKCRLDVREGKALGHDLVGVFLMSKSSCQERIGCHIWADQLKGHRIRIVGCVGKFMFPCGRVINMEEIPAKPVGNDPIGWVSYRNRQTREEYVTRISGTLLQEYIFNG